jgi:hypothetical protein
MDIDAAFFDKTDFAQYVAYTGGSGFIDVDEVKIERPITIARVDAHAGASRQNVFDSVLSHVIGQKNGQTFQ